MTALMAVALCTTAATATERAATVALRGVVSPRCELTKAPEPAQGATRQNPALLYTFGITCNRPFALSARSERGGLQSPYPGRTQDAIGYDVEIDIPGAGPVRRFRSDAPPAGGETGNAADTIARAVFDGTGRIRVTFDPRARNGGTLEEILAGAYVDTLRITLMPLD